MNRVTMAAPLSALLLTLAWGSTASVAAASGLPANDASNRQAQLADAAGANFLVLFSSSPAHRKGETLASGTLIELAAKQKMVLLDEGGQSQTLNGPVKTALARPGPAVAGSSMLATVGRALSSTGSVQMTLGATRGQASADLLGLGWTADIAQDSHVCLPASGGVFLTLGNNERGRVELASGAQRHAMVWNAGSDRMLWPRGLGVADGSRVTARLPGRSTDAAFVIHVLPASLVTIGAQLQWLAERGCGAQAAQLVDGLYSESPAGRLSIRSASGQAGRVTAHIGTDLELAVTGDRDGYLSCLYSSQGRMARIFPAKSGNAGAVRAGIPQRVPALDGAALQVTQPAGTDRVTCVLADRPGSEWLPAPLKGGEMPDMAIGADDPLKSLPQQWQKAQLSIQVQP